jgi:putative transposase
LDFPQGRTPCAPAWILFYNHRMQLHHRHLVRLPGYDYSQAGVYFLTLAAHNRPNIFGEIRGDEFHASPIGQIILEEWNAAPGIRQKIELDEFVSMTNHLHGMIVIHENCPSIAMAGVGASGRLPLPEGRQRSGLRPHSLGSYVAGFKSAAATRINQLRTTPGEPDWQRNDCEHIVRDEEELAAFHAYIRGNPLRWGGRQ